MKIQSQLVGFLQTYVLPEIIELLYTLGISDRDNTSHHSWRWQQPFFRQVDFLKFISTSQTRPILPLCTKPMLILSKPVIPINFVTIPGSFDAGYEDYSQDQISGTIPDDPLRCDEKYECYWHEQTPGLIAICKPPPGYYTPSCSVQPQNSDNQGFLCPLCNTFNKKSPDHNYTCKNCRTCFTEQSKPKAYSEASHNCKSNSKSSSLPAVTATAGAVSASTSTIPGIFSHSLAAASKTKLIIIDNSSSAPYQELNSGCYLIWKPDQDCTRPVLHIGDESSGSEVDDVELGRLHNETAVSSMSSSSDIEVLDVERLMLHNETEMSTQNLEERNDMEMLVNPQAITGQTAVSSVSSDVQYGGTSLEPNETEMSATSQTININVSSEDPEEGNDMEMPEIPKSNDFGKYFGMIIIFFILQRVFSSTHSSYFDCAMTASFISILCSKFLQSRRKVAASILEKIGLMSGASGVIVAMVTLFLPPNLSGIGWFASLIICIVVLLS